MTTAPKLPEGLETIRALCAGRVEWRVARDGGACCMSFNRDDSCNPEQEANEWLARHLCDYPERFMGYKVQRVVVQSQLQEEALALIVRLSDAQAALQALAAEKEAEIAALKLQIETGPLYSTRLKAKRYELLRRGQQWSVINGIGDTLRADELDAAIDSALLAEKETK